MKEVSGTLNLAQGGQAPRGGFLLVTYRVEDDGRLTGEIEPHVYYTPKPMRDSEGGLIATVPIAGHFSAE